MSDSDFIIKSINNANWEHELEIVGFDKSYSHKFSDKFMHKNLKIYNLKIAQANILKQIALTVGADCAVHRETITGKTEFSDVILCGSFSQLNKIAHKLKGQPFSLSNLGENILNQLFEKHNKTKLVGILNITPNSFSDGGDFLDFENAKKHLNQLIIDGADIIDIGAESTKPYSKPISSEEQLKRLVPILEYIKLKEIKTPISIDTRNAEVAQKCIDFGVSIINDVSGFDFDKKMADVITNNPQIKIILQHSQGTPETMQDAPHYENLMDEIFINLKTKIDFALSKGIKKENIIIDPGIGFGKTKAHNMEILKRWQELKTFGCPILIGLSRKSLLGMPEATNEEKDIYTLALDSVLITQKIDYIRVHNVKLHKTFQDMLN